MQLLNMTYVVAIAAISNTHSPFCCFTLGPLMSCITFVFKEPCLGALSCSPAVCCVAQPAAGSTQQSKAKKKKNKKKK
jgi:hypothetical protein